MQTKLTALVAANLLTAICLSGHAQGTAFTYQGRLNSSGAVANGSYDLRFAVFDGVSAGTQQGNTLTNAAITVSNGVFTVMLDFGNQFPGANRWLEIGVRSNGGGTFTTLSPRQPITPTPYAVTASNLTGALPATQLSGVLPSANLSGTYSSAVTLNNAANSFSGSGANLTALNASQLTTGTVPDGRLSANVSLLGPSIESAEITDGTIVNADINAAAAIADTKLATLSTAGKVANSATTATNGNAPNTIVARDASGNFSAGTITASNLNGVLSAASLSGAIPSANLSGTYSSAVTLNNAANSFSGSGANLTALNALQLTSGTVPDARLAANVARTNQVWLLGGNAGTTAGTHFLGTSDSQPLELRVNGLRALRLEDNGDSNDPDTTPDGAPNVIGGSPNNFVAAGVVGAVIGGGGATNSFGQLFYSNSVAADYGMVGGGLGNNIAANSPYATIAGGILNAIGTNCNSSAIGGGSNNKVAANSAYATIAGGSFNNIGTNSDYSAIGGGENNYIADNTFYGAIAGGSFNKIADNSLFATIPGGVQNSATNYAFAAGRRAKAVTTGTFVWADSTDADFTSTAANQFLIRATGGVGIGVTNPAAQLHISSSGGDSFPQARINQEDTSASGYARLRFTVGGEVNKRWDVACRSNVFVIYSGQFSSEMLRLDSVGLTVNGTFVSASDRNAKENFAPVQPREVLEKVVALPLSEWSYKQDASARHIGPMAQDFHAAFGVGPDNKHISMVDADGVALAAIQGLNEKVEVRSERSEVRSQKAESRIQKLEAENAELKRRLEALEAIILSHK